jgi:hypothetical protein
LFYKDKLSKRQGPQDEAKPDAKKSELKIGSQSRPRRKKKGFICSKTLKKLRTTALKRNRKSLFLPQIGLIDHPTRNDNRMHRSLEGVPISG